MYLCDFSSIIIGNIVFNHTVERTHKSSYGLVNIFISRFLYYAFT